MQLPPGVSEDDLSQLVAITSKPREHCLLALVLAEGKVDVACSIIFEGLTTDQMRVMIAQAAQRGGINMGGGDNDDSYDDQPMQMPGMGGGMGGGGGAGRSFEEIVNNPSFAPLLARMREDPQVYTEFMQTLA